MIREKYVEYSQNTSSNVIPTHDKTSTPSEQASKEERRKAQALLRVSVRNPPPPQPGTKNVKLLSCVFGTMGAEATAAHRVMRNDANVRLFSILYR